jgi:heptosyltransferase II
MDYSLKVRGNKRLPVDGIDNILIRGTNWIGDAVMTMPAVAAIRESYPRARISILVKPWVAELFHISPFVDEVIIFDDPGRHSGAAGILRLSGELKQKRFDAAILLQNAIKAAIIAKLAAIPIRAGYNSDVRGPLLTHSVRRTKAIRKVHQVEYYLEMLKSLGLKGPADRKTGLSIPPSYGLTADRILESHGIGGGNTLIGIAPGATYGPAKKWHPERFAAVADRLMADFPDSHAILFGSEADKESTGGVIRNAGHAMADLAGMTNLKEAIALISRCSLFISNDSGLMHVAGALNIPTVAIFGSTNPVTTSPLGDHSLVIRKDVACSPCLKVTCPTDFRCMDLIGADDVYNAAVEMMAGRVKKGETVS